MYTAMSGFPTYVLTFTKLDMIKYVQCSHLKIKVYVKDCFVLELIELKFSSL